jgi:hypothetical protein
LAIKVTIIDLVERKPATDLFNRKMNPSFASVMPQVIAVWCEELGHQVRYICYTGQEDLVAPAGDTDLLIVGGFTRAAFTAYALSNIYRAKGAVTALGGPHARCYPEDAAKYFDYVFGFTGKEQIAEMLREAAPHRPRGRELAAPIQPSSIPSLRQRWKFVESALANGGPIKIVPMIGSFGCPYTCSFCIDANVPYQPLDFAELRDDLAFLATKVKNPLVGWHDPNFGVRFDDYMNAIESAVPKGTIRHIAEMSLSLLGDDNLVRLKANSFVGMLPGIESWYQFGYKSKTTRVSGEDKVRQIADHVNRLVDHIPFVQTNFILGLDCDEGEEPFELTKKFIDWTPGAYPAFSLFTCYGRASPLNLELQRAGRVNAIPFHFLDSNHGMNIRPLHYDWADFYDHVAGITQHAQGARGVWRRLKANGPGWAGVFNFLRGATAGRSGYDAELARLLHTDHQLRAFMNGETRDLPEFFRFHARKDLGAFWDALPEGALMHDPYAYMNGELAAVA